MIKKDANKFFCRLQVLELVTKLIKPNHTLYTGSTPLYYLQNIYMYHETYMLIIL